MIVVSMLTEYMELAVYRMLWLSVAVSLATFVLSDEKEELRLLVKDVSSLFVVESKDASEEDFGGTRRVDTNEGWAVPFLISLFTNSYGQSTNFSIFAFQIWALRLKDAPRNHRGMCFRNGKISTGYMPPPLARMSTHSSARFRKGSLSDFI